MEGVSTNIAGIIGVAVKGPVGSAPRMVTNLSDFKRIYGNYLSEGEFGKYCFLVYIVEHFFSIEGPVVLRPGLLRQRASGTRLKIVPDFLMVIL